MPGGRGKITAADAKPFVKGDPRINRKGRPKLPNLNVMLAEIMNEEKDGHTALSIILKRLKQMAAKGDLGAIRELLDRAYGKARQNMDISVKQEPQIDLNRLTPEEREKWFEFLDKALIAKEDD